MQPLGSTPDFDLRAVRLDLHACPGEEHAWGSWLTHVQYATGRNLTQRDATKRNAHTERDTRRGTYARRGDWTERNGRYAYWAGCGVPEVTDAKRNTKPRDATNLTPTLQTQLNYAGSLHSDTQRNFVSVL